MYMLLKTDTGKGNFYVNVYDKDKVEFKMCVETLMKELKK